MKKRDFFEFSSKNSSGELLPPGRPDPKKILHASTRQSAIAVVRRLFKMGPKMVERRLKTVRRLFHPLLVAMCAMLKKSARSAEIFF